MSRNEDRGAVITVEESHTSQGEMIPPTHRVTGGGGRTAETAVNRAWWERGCLQSAAAFGCFWLPDVNLEFSKDLWPPALD